MKAPMPPPAVDSQPERSGPEAPRVKGARLSAVFLLGVLLFNYPLLALFDRAATVLGIPVLYAYIFFAWALLIALLALVVEPRR